MNSYTTKSNIRRFYPNLGFRIKKPLSASFWPYPKKKIHFFSQKIHFLSERKFDLSERKTSDKKYNNNGYIFDILSEYPKDVISEVSEEIFDIRRNQYNFKKGKMKTNLDESLQCDCTT